MSGLTTHVLDTARGLPAVGMRVDVHTSRDGGWVEVGGGVTNADGRVPGLLPDGPLAAGTYRLTFGTGAWFEAQGIEGFYPEVSVVCAIDDPTRHYHVPLLISPFAFSTYRGS
jgi:5-hydroxyisourate hydrolase